MKVKNRLFPGAFVFCPVKFYVGDTVKRSKMIWAGKRGSISHRSHTVMTLLYTEQVRCTLFALIRDSL